MLHHINRKHQVVGIRFLKLGQIGQFKFHPVNQASAVGDRLRRDVPPGPSYVPAALTFAALLAVAIVVGRPVRGRVLSRGPDSPGRSRLTDIGIDRQ